MCAQIRLSSGSEWEDRVGYSRLIKSGPVVEVSGTVAVDDKGKVQGNGDPYAQARFVLDKIGKVLKRAGISLQDVTRTRIYVKNIDHWPEVSRAHREVFGNIRPSSTMVEVGQLILPDLLVEIEVSAMTEAQHCYAYPRPALTTDILLTRNTESGLQLLLIKRRGAPFEGRWALPGGFVEEHETLEACAGRELEEETGLREIPLRQFKAYSAPGRDPRGWTISVVFYGEMDPNRETEIRAGDDAAETAWFNYEALPNLAFDHELIIREYHDANVP